MTSLVRPYFRIPVILIFIGTLFSNTLDGQAFDPAILRSHGNNERADSLQQARARLLASEYAQVIIDPLSYREGMEYEIYFNPSFSTPLLLFKLVSSSTLVMKGRVYEGLLLYYDTFLGEVILPDMGRITAAGQPGMIVLNKSVIQRVTFYTFGQEITLENVHFPDSVKPEIEDGFYEIGYSGYSKLYTKHVSSRDLREGMDYYTLDKIHFVVIGNESFQIKKANSLFRLLMKKDPELKRVMKPVRDKYYLSDEVRIIEMLNLFDNHFADAK